MANQERKSTDRTTKEILLTEGVVEELTRHGRAPIINFGGHFDKQHKWVNAEAIVRVPPVGVTFKSRYRPSDEDSDLHEFFDKDGKSQGLEQIVFTSKEEAEGVISRRNKVLEELKIGRPIYHVFPYPDSGIVG